VEDEIDPAVTGLSLLKHHNLALHLLNEGVLETGVQNLCQITQYISTSIIQYLAECRLLYEKINATEDEHDQ